MARNPVYPPGEVANCTVPEEANCATGQENEDPGIEFLTKAGVLI